MKDLVPDHLDNNGLNNYYKNLEWKTRGENTKSAHEKWYINNSCSSHSGSLITNKQAKEICKYLEKDLSYDEIISKMKFPNTDQYRKLLIRIKNGIAWTNISCKYDIKKDKIKYTEKQKETIKHIPLIRELIIDGFTNYEIIRKIWGNLNEKEMKSKNETISKIRKNEIFKDIP